MKSNMKTMVVSLVVMTAAAGAILAAVKMFTGPAALATMEKQRREAIVEVLPPFSDITVSTDSALTVYNAIGSDGTPAGVAVESFSDAGFGGRISILAGFDASGRLTGYRVLSHSETPGLGANMDHWFRAEGTAHNVLGSTGSLAVTKDGGSVDAITGATISSRAFLEALNRARSAAFARP